VQIDRNGLEVLDREQCLALLRTATLGRVGLTSGALPVILPVNFHLDGDQVLIRSGEGTKLEAAMRDAVVAFEADDFDPIDHSGWSVVVTGVARLLDDPAAKEAIRRLPLARWAPSGNGHVVAISAELVTGRRLDRLRTLAN
jgi:nitroimidazol reductase NimA-like FMN-containing flavoprotein (pyridoxamine 5'-phosphate oxidase superfamily)